MEEYFKTRIDRLNNKIEAWNDKNIFQRLFAKEKWSEDHTFNELEKIFHLRILEEITSDEEFSIYLKHFLEYNKALSSEKCISIVEYLLKSDYLNPKIEIQLENYLNATKAKNYHNQRAIDLINSIK